MLFGSHHHFVTEWNKQSGTTYNGIINQAHHPGFSAGAWAFVIYTAFHTGFGGSLGWKPMVKAFTAPAIAVVWYLAVWGYRRMQGINLTRTFQEIPPE